MSPPGSYALASPAATTPAGQLRLGFAGGYNSRFGLCSGVRSAARTKIRIRAKCIAARKRDVLHAFGRNDVENSFRIVAS
jgi:hypothetical protein